MPAARYWRAVGLQSVGGGALELSALHLYLGGVRVDAAATLTSAIAPAGGTLAALQDDDTATTARWLEVSTPGFALVWDFGAGNAQDVGAVRLGSGAAYAEWLETLALQYSSDGAVWETLGHVAGLLWPGAQALQDLPTSAPPGAASLLHFEGGFTDECGITWTPVGGASLSTAQKKFGASSVQFAADGYLSAASAPSLNFGTGDFTVAFFVLRGAIQTTYGTMLANALPGFSPGVRYIMLNAFHGGRLSIGGFDAKTGSGVYELDGNPLLVSTTYLSSDRFEHVKVERKNGVVALYINGVKEAEAQSTAPFNFGQSGALLGANHWDGPQGRFTGCIDEFIALPYAADVFVPTAPYGFASQGAAKMSASKAPSPILLSGGSAGDTVMTLPPATIHLDRQDANGTEANAPATRYRIPGPRWVKEKTASTNVPLRRRVQLYNQRDSRLVREVWSDPVTGEYSFDNIRGDTTYFVIAFDHTGHYRAVIADNLTPEPIP